MKNHSSTHYYILHLCWVIIASSCIYKKEITSFREPKSYYVSGSKPVGLYSTPDESSIVLQLDPGTNILGSALYVSISPFSKKRWLNIVPDPKETHIGRHEYVTGWISADDVSEGFIGADVSESSIAYGPYRLKAHRIKCDYADMNRCVYYTAAGYPFYGCYSGKRFRMIANGSVVAVSKQSGTDKSCSLNSKQWMLASPGIPLSFKNDQLIILQVGSHVRGESEPCNLTQYELQDSSVIKRRIESNSSIQNLVRSVSQNELFFGYGAHTVCKNL